MERSILGIDAFHIGYFLSFSLFLPFKLYELVVNDYIISYKHYLIIISQSGYGKTEM